MSARCGCGRTWTGFAQAHCSVCHRHFSTVAAFDAHGPTPCADPAAVRIRDGKHAGNPRFVALESSHGVTWGMANHGPRPEHWTKPEDAT